MKKLRLVSFVLMLWMPLVAVAHNRTRLDDTKQDNVKAEKVATKAVKISGKVSSDGKKLVSDSDNRTWTVTNPDALKGYEGQQVAVKGHLDAGKDEIQVISVKPRRTYGRTPEQP